MVTLTTRIHRERGVALVACRLRNEASTPRVAWVANGGDGPANVPVACDREDATLRVTVPAEATVGTGFSTTGATGEPPATVVDEAAPDGVEAGEVIGGLSEPRPPQAAVVGDAADVTATATGRDDRFVDCEARIERLAAVDAATTLPAATRVLAEEGGLDAVRALDARVRADRTRLLAVADRALTLAGRAETARPPVETLERLS